MLYDGSTPFFLSLGQVQCDELVERTAIICTEKNAFSQIVSVRLFELHGAWNCSQLEEKKGLKTEGMDPLCQNNGIPCLHCYKHVEGKEDNSITEHTFSQLNKKIKTPLCSNEELEANGRCRYAVEAVATLAAIREFNRHEGLLIHRIRNSSNVVRYGLRSSRERET